MKTIILSHGFSALVDDEDYERLRIHKWYARENNTGRTWYAVRWPPAGGTIYMHREVMGNPPGQIDHKEHHEEKRLIDNRKSNLRASDHSGNQANARKKRRIASSIFKGVNLTTGGKNWESGIEVRGKRIYLGVFTVEVHAAYAYDLAAVKHFGEFALTNFPVPGSPICLFGDEG